MSDPAMILQIDPAAEYERDDVTVGRIRSEQADDGSPGGKPFQSCLRRRKSYE